MELSHRNNLNLYHQEPSSTEEDMEGYYRERHVRVVGFVDQVVEFMQREQKEDESLWRIREGVLPDGRGIKIQLADYTQPYLLEDDWDAWHWSAQKNSRIEIEVDAKREDQIGFNLEWYIVSETMSRLIVRAGTHGLIGNEFYGADVRLTDDANPQHWYEMAQIVLKLALEYLNENGVIGQDKATRRIQSGENTTGHLPPPRE